LLAGSRAARGQKTVSDILKCLNYRVILLYIHNLQICPRAAGWRPENSVNSQTLKTSWSFTKVQDGGDDDYDYINNKWQRRTEICRNMLMK
jgi:hypothetical protein